MGANVKLAEAMGETAKTMGEMNKVMDPQKLAGTMREFEMANAKMSMTEETSKYNIIWHFQTTNFMFLNNLLLLMIIV